LMMKIPRCFTTSPSSQPHPWGTRQLKSYTVPLALSPSLERWTWRFMGIPRRSPFFLGMNNETIWNLCLITYSLAHL
jgi:hypothetical protein